MKPRRALRSISARSRAEGSATAGNETRDRPAAHELDALARELTARLAAVAPDWTDQPDSDPGVTLLELAAYLAESIGTRGTASPQDLARLRAVVARLDYLAMEGCGDGTPTRVHYVEGMLLTADDFEQEQTYHRARARRHNRLLHGVGVVRGLAVSIETSPRGETVVVVAPGVAIGPDGDELVLCDPVRISPCPDASPCFVSLRLVERPTGVLPSGEASRIEETAEVVPHAHVHAGDLVIARLVRDGTAWRVDR